MDAPVQPQVKDFPRTAFGDRRRNFNASWYAQHAWIEYYVCKDAVFCYACRHFGLPNSEITFTGTGFRNWKKAMYKDGGFAAHAKSEAHSNAVLAWRDFEKAGHENTSLLNILSQDHSKLVQENRHYIKKFAEVLLLTATQNIAQEAIGESEKVDNRGNFLAILELLANHDPVVEKKMNGVQNAKYTSHQIQNEVLDKLAEMVRSTIIKEMKESQVFALMADETKDEISALEKDCMRLPFFSFPI